MKLLPFSLQLYLGWTLAYLKKALHILQYKHSTVTEVVLLRHSGVGTFHELFGKASLASFLNFPFYLQVSKKYISVKYLSAYEGQRFKITLKKKKWLCADGIRTYDLSYMLGKFPNVYLRLKPLYNAAYFIHCFCGGPWYKKSQYSTSYTAGKRVSHCILVQ